MRRHFQNFADFALHAFLLNNQQSSQKLHEIRSPVRKAQSGGRSKT